MNGRLKCLEAQRIKCSLHTQRRRIVPPHCENNSFIISVLQWGWWWWCWWVGLLGAGQRDFESGLELTTKVTDNCRWNVESANWTHSATINCLRIHLPIAKMPDAILWRGAAGATGADAMGSRGRWAGRSFGHGCGSKLVRAARNNRPAFALN